LRLRSDVLLRLFTRQVMAYEAAARGANHCVPLSNEVATYAANSCALQTSRSLRLSRGRNSKNGYGKHQCFYFHFASQYRAVEKTI
jgi:hypothetical protein